MSAVAHTHALLPVPSRRRPNRTRSAALSAAMNRAAVSPMIKPLSRPWRWNPAKHERVRAAQGE